MINRDDITGFERLLGDLGREPDSIRLTPDELLLIDWTLSAASHLIPGAADLDDYLKWDHLRSAVWAVVDLVTVPVKDFPDYIGLDPERAYEGRLLEIERTDARLLLAIIPPTFKWGTGPDCGFSLKVKLWRYIEGVYHDPKRDQDVAQAPDVAEGEAKP